MIHAPSLPAVHPPGDQPVVGSGAGLAPPARPTLDTFGGPVTVEWDRSGALTPLGQMPFFIEFLKVSGLFDAFVGNCPLRYTSPNAPKKREIHTPIAIAA